MKVIILAAGQGKRMLPLTQEAPKCLLTIGNQTLLSRLLQQLGDRGAADITVVVGFQKEKTIREIQRSGQPAVRIVENDRYEEDVNILSLALALDGQVAPFVVFEADVILDDAALQKVLDVSDGARSYWYTIGPFLYSQSGGICRAGPDGAVTDVQVVDGYYPRYAGYKKLIGLLTVGRDEAAAYTGFLTAACRKSVRQYYLAPWIDNVASLRSYECRLDGHMAVAINTPGEYREAVKTFSVEAR